MKKNPKGDWCIEDLKKIAQAFHTTYQSSGRQNWVASSPSAPRNDANLRHCERSEAIQNIHLLNAKWYQIQFRQPGSSHVIFRTDTGKKLTVPVRKPIKPIY